MRKGTSSTRDMRFRRPQYDIATGSRPLFLRRPYYERMKFCIPLASFDYRCATIVILQDARIS